MKGLWVGLVFCAASARAATWDNEAGNYAMSRLPDAATEALRLDTDEREDQQPLGRIGKKCEAVFANARKNKS